MSQPVNTTHECLFCGEDATIPYRWYDYGDEDTPECWRDDWMCVECRCS